MAHALQSGLRDGGLSRGGLHAGLGNGSIFNIASLDLNFAKYKNIASLVTFTRASSGTFVGSDGVLRTAVTNLLPRSEEFSDASWGKVSTTVTANSEASPTGSVTADTLTWGALQTAEAYQAVTLTAATWTFSIYAKTTSGIKKFRLKYWNGTSELFSAEQTATTQWQRFSYTFTGVAVSGNVSVRNSNPAEAGDLIVWGAQLEESATVGEYIPTTSVINSAPRFDHNPTTGESLGLLVEEARTNSYTWSEDISNAAWSKSEVTVTNDATTAPNGATTADQLTPSTTSAGHTFSRLGIIGAAGTFTDSVYAKANGYNFLVSTADSGGFVIYNLSNGTIDSSSVATGFIIAAGNGWYRCSTTRTTTAAATVQYQIRATAGSFSFAGDGTSGIYLWGAQLEAGAFPTSYIPTTTAAATRSADVASIGSSAFTSFYNQSEGTVFAEASTYVGTAAVSRGLWSIETDGNNVHRFFRQSDQQPVSQTIVGGASQSTFGFGAIWNTTTTRKLSYAYALNNFASTFDAVGIQTDTSGTLPTVSTLNIGSLSGANQFGGTIKRLCYWRQALPGSTLQAITG